MKNKIACISTLKCFEHLMRECNLRLKNQQVFHRVGSQYDLDGVQFSNVLMLGDSFYHLTNPQELIDGAMARTGQMNAEEKKILTDAVAWVTTDTAHKAPEQLTSEFYIHHIQYLMREIDRAIKFN